jgi:BASS family bile acid:Na+ symporter
VHGIIHAIVAIASSQLVTLLSFDMGLSLRWGVLRKEARNPVLWRAVVAAVLGVPLLAILVAATLPLNPPARGVIVLMAISPGAPMLMNKARKSGNLALAVTLALVLTFAALVSVPVEIAVLNRLFPVDLHASSAELLRRLLPKLLLPLVLGFVVRGAWPAGAKAMEPFIRRLFQLALLVAAIGAVAASWYVVAHMSPWAWLAMLLVTTGAVLLGETVGGREPRDRATVVYAIVWGNPAIAMAVVGLSYPELRAVPIIVTYALLRAVLVLPYAVLSSRRLSVRAPSSDRESSAATHGGRFDGSRRRI